MFMVDFTLNTIEIISCVWNIQIATWSPFYKHVSTLIPACISNHMPSRVWDEIIYPFPNIRHGEAAGV